MSKPPKTETMVSKTAASYGQFKWSDDGAYCRGTVETPCGIVKVYSQEPGSKKDGYTTLTIILSGTSYYKTIWAGYRDKYLITLSRRFAQESYRKKYPK